MDQFIGYAALLCVSALMVTMIGITVSVTFATWVFESRVFRPIVAAWMKVWIDTRAERRKRLDEKRIHQFFEEFARASYCPAQWERVPQRLKWRIQKRIADWIRERAEWGWQDLPLFIQNARICGMEMAAEEVERMYRRIMTNDTSSIETRLHFARLLHGAPLPLDAVLEILKGHGEWRILGCLYQTGNLEPLLDAIDRNDPTSREMFLETIAAHGRFRQLKEVYELLDEPICPERLRQCFDAHLEHGRGYPHDVATMCIWLKDWDKARALIDTWSKSRDQHLHGLAAQLALALHQDERGSRIDEP